MEILRVFFSEFFKKSVLAFWLKLKATVFKILGINQRNDAVHSLHNIKVSDPEIRVILRRIWPEKQTEIEDWIKEQRDNKRMNQRYSRLKKLPKDPSTVVPQAIDPKLISMKSVKADLLCWKIFRDFYGEEQDKLQFEEDQEDEEDGNSSFSELHGDSHYFEESRGRPSRNNWKKADIIEMDGSNNILNFAKIQLISQKKEEAEIQQLRAQKESLTEEVESIYTDINDRHECILQMLGIMKALDPVFEEAKQTLDSQVPTLKNAKNNLKDSETKKKMFFEVDQSSNRFLRDNSAVNPETYEQGLKKISQINWKRATDSKLGCLSYASFYHKQIEALMEFATVKSKVYKHSSEDLQRALEQELHFRQEDYNMKAHFVEADHSQRKRHSIKIDDNVDDVIQTLVNMETQKQIKKIKKLQKYEDPTIKINPDEKTSPKDNYQKINLVKGEFSLGQDLLQSMSPPASPGVGEDDVDDYSMYPDDEDQDNDPSQITFNQSNDEDEDFAFASKNPSMMYLDASEVQKSSNNLSVNGLPGKNKQRNRRKSMIDTYIPKNVSNLIGQSATGKPSSKNTVMNEANQDDFMQDAFYGAGEDEGLKKKDTIKNNMLQLQKEGVTINQVENSIKPIHRLAKHVNRLRMLSRFSGKTGQLTSMLKSIVEGGEEEQKEKIEEEEEDSLDMLKGVGDQMQGVISDDDVFEIDDLDELEAPKTTQRPGEGIMSLTTFGDDDDEDSLDPINIIGNTIKGTGEIQDEDDLHMINF